MIDAKDQPTEGTKVDSINDKANKEEVAVAKQDDGTSNVSRDTPSAKESSLVSAPLTEATSSLSISATAANDVVSATKKTNGQVTSISAAATAVHGDGDSKNKTQSSVKNEIAVVESVKIDNPTNNAGADAISSPNSAASAAAAVTQIQNSTVIASTQATNIANTTTYDKAGGDHATSGGDMTVAASSAVIPPQTQPTVTSSSSSKQNISVLQVPAKKVESAIFSASSQIEQIPNNILKLLQTYGPLTVKEIAYNIPPTDLSVPSIVEVMRALNVIHYHEDGGYYYFHNGEIRGDTIYPSEIIDVIQDTQEEIKETMERIQLLKEELQQDVHMQNRARSAREFLKNLVGKYDGEGGIRGDPVYATALKTLNVDLGMKRKLAELEPAQKKKSTRKKLRKVPDGSSDMGNDVNVNVALNKDDKATMVNDETCKHGQEPANEQKIASPSDETQLITPMEQTSNLEEEKEQILEQQQVQ